MSAATAEAIVTALGRKVLPIQGYGNCLFHAFGYYFHGRRWCIAIHKYYCHILLLYHATMTALYWMVMSKTMAGRCSISQFRELK